MSKYPYIGKNSNLIGDFSIAIFYGEKRGALLENTIDDIPLHEHMLDFNEREFKNITAEYLANTYGKVESKEHADFIVKLAEANGINVFGWYEEGDSWFNFNLGDLYFWTEDFEAKSEGEKLITIPLPPKDKSMESQKERPAVGDEVLFQPNPSRPDKIKATVKYIGDKFTILKSVSGREFSRRNAKLLIEKPPTPEEELEKALLNYAKSDSYSCEWRGFAKSIINGEIKGLSYKPE